MILLTGGVSAPWGCLLWGVSVPRGCLLWGGGVCSRGVSAPRGSALGGCLLWGGLVETPRDGYCCGRYASYWNAFLSEYMFPWFWVGLWRRGSCYCDQSRLHINEDFQKHYYLIDLNIIGHCRNKSVTNCPVS